MALTKVSRGLLSTGIVDNSNATAITLNADESATFANDITVTGNTGIGVAAHASAALNITTANQHMRLNNGSELGVISLLSSGELELWAHGADETINFRTGGGSGTVAMNIVGTKVGIGVSNPSDYNSSWDDLVVGGTGSHGITIASGTTSSGTLAFADGTSGTAEYSGYIQYNHNTNLMAFGTNGATAALNIDSSGRVGLGVSQPSATLDISAPTNTTPLEINVATDNNGYVTHRNAAGTDIAYYGVGSSVITGGGSNDFGIRAQSGHLLLSAGGSIERLSIDPSGNLGYGNRYDTGLNNTGFYLNSTGLNMYQVQAGTSSSTYHVYDTNANAFKFYVGYTGTVHATNPTISQISDVRLKENIRDLPAVDGLEKILALKPRKFDWKKGKGADIKDVRGFVAQEFEEVFPDLIDHWLDEPPEGEEPYKAVRADLIPTLVKAIQEQQLTITDLTTRLTALENN